MTSEEVLPHLEWPKDENIAFQKSKILQNFVQWVIFKKFLTKNKNWKKKIKKNSKIGVQIEKKILWKLEKKLPLSNRLATP